MAAKRDAYKCTDCGKVYPKWQGQCTGCKSWSTIEENTSSSSASSLTIGTKSKSGPTTSKPAQRAKDIDLKAEGKAHKPTGIGELDRVLGGGIVDGAAILLAGPPGVGKALALDTPIITTTGWKNFGDLIVGDSVFGDDGQPASVVALSEIWENRPCYELVFSDGAVIVADANHEWLVRDELSGEHNTVTTFNLHRALVLNGFESHAYSVGFAPTLDVQEDSLVNEIGMSRLPIDGRRYIEEVNSVESVPVRCIEVGNESHLFLAGRELIPTHNSSILATVSSTISNKENVLYVSGEESIEQITLRHKRMNALGDNLFIAAESDLSKVLWHIDEIDPKLIIVDSLQTIASPDIDGRSGSVSQVTEVGTILTRIAKDRNIPVVFVGHYTKDGNVAGPRVVEHLVDVVLAFEGEEDSPLRILRGIKNRFGPADEIGCFEHTEDGLDEVPDPSGMLLGSRTRSIPGVATSIYLEGKRALPVEVQAIVLESQLQNPKKGTAGLDPVRTMMLHAIIQKHSAHSIRLSDKDVYVSTTGGIRVKETAVDLATVVAIASDALNLSSRFDQVCIGEVTLSGEIRRVPGMTRRLTEAQRLGFSAALVPNGTKEKLPSSLTRPDAPLKIIEIKNIGHMVNSLRGVQASIESGNLT